MNWISFLLNSDDLILDIGCGQQVLARVFENYRIISMDLSKHCLEVPPVVQADAEKIPFASNAFRTVVLTETLEHVVNPYLVLREAKRVSKIGGHFIISVPHVRMEIPTHLRHYDEKTLRDEIEPLGRIDNLDKLEMHYACHGTWTF